MQSISEFERFVAAEYVEQEQRQDANSAPAVEVSDLRTIVAYRDKPSNGESPPKPRKICKPVAFNAKFVSVQLDEAGEACGLWTVPPTSVDSERPDLELRDFNSGSRTLSIASIKSGCHVSAVLHAPVIDDTKPEIPDFTWVGLNDGSIRLLSTGRTFEAGFNSPTSNGEIHVMFEIPKAHAGAITCFALSPHRQAVEGVSDSSQVAPLDESARDHRKRFNNNICVGSLDSFVSVWSLSAVYAETSRVLLDAKDAKEPLTSSRDLVNLTIVDPFDDSDSTKIRCRCLVVQAKPLVRLKHSVAGIRTMTWCTSVCLDSSALPTHWAQDYELRQVKRWARPANKFGIDVDELDDKLDDPDPDVEAQKLRTLRKQTFIHDASNINDTEVVYGEINNNRAEVSIDILITGDEEGRVVMWDILHELRAESPAMISPAPYHRPTPSAWGNRELPVPPKGSAAARTSPMRIDFPFGVSVVAISAVLPGTLPIHSREKATQHDCLRAFFSNLDLVIALADGSLQLVCCHVKSSSALDDEECLPRARRPAGQTVQLRIPPELSVDQGFTHDDYTVVFTHRERYLNPRKPVSCGVNLPSLNLMWLAAAGVENFVIDTTSFAATNRSLNEQGHVATIAAGPVQASSRLMLITKSDAALEINTMVDVPDDADALIFDKESNVAVYHRATQEKRLKRAEEKRLAKNEAKEWRRKFKETSRRLNLLQGVLSEKRDRSNGLNKLRRNVFRQKWIRRIAFDKVIFDERDARIQIEDAQESSWNSHAQSLWRNTQICAAAAVTQFNDVKHRQQRLETLMAFARRARRLRQRSKIVAVLADANSTLRHVFRRWMRHQLRIRSQRVQKHVFVAAQRTLLLTGSELDIRSTIDNQVYSLEWKRRHLLAAARDQLTRVRVSNDTIIRATFFASWRTRIDIKRNARDKAVDDERKVKAENSNCALVKSVALIRLEEQEDVAHEDRSRLELEDVAAARNDVSSSFGSTVVAHQILFPLPCVAVEPELAPATETSQATTTETAQATTETAQATTETAQATTETAQATTETAQPTTETAQATTETAQATTETTQATTETTQATTDTAQAAPAAANPTVDSTLLTINEPKVVYESISQFFADGSSAKAAAVKIVRSTIDDVDHKIVLIERDLRALQEPSLVANVKRLIVEPALTRGDLDCIIYDEHCVIPAEPNADEARLSEALNSMKTVLGFETVEEIETEIRARIEGFEEKCFAIFSPSYCSSAAWTKRREWFNGLVASQRELSSTTTTTAASDAIALRAKLPQDWWGWTELDSVTIPIDFKDTSCTTFESVVLAPLLDGAVLKLRSYEAEIEARLGELEAAIANPVEANKHILEDADRLRRELQESSRAFDDNIQNADASINADRKAADEDLAADLKLINDERETARAEMTSAEEVFMSLPPGSEEQVVNDRKKEYLEKSEHFEAKQVVWSQNEASARANHGKKHEALDKRATEVSTQMSDEEKRRQVESERIAAVEASASDVQKFEAEKQALIEFQSTVVAASSQRKSFQKQLSASVRAGFTAAPEPEPPIDDCSPPEFVASNNVWARKLLQRGASEQDRALLAKHVATIAVIIDSILVSAFNDEKAPQATTPQTQSFGNTSMTPMVRAETEQPGPSFNTHASSHDADQFKSLFWEALEQRNAVHAVLSSRP